jgi:hypothetical protein
MAKGAILVDHFAAENDSRFKAKFNSGRLKL